MPVVVRKWPLRAQRVGTRSSCGSHFAWANIQELQAFYRKRHDLRWALTTTCHYLTLALSTNKCLGFKALACQVGCVGCISLVHDQPKVQGILE